MKSCNHTLMKRCLAMTLVALLVSGCERRVRYYILLGTWGPDNSYSSYVVYGFTGSRVNFAVFQSEEGAIDLIRANMDFSGGFCKGYLRLPDDSKVDLPTSNRIYEIASGKLTSAPIDFTRAQLNSYLESHPKPPTIEGFKHFLAKAPLSRRKDRTPA